MNRPHFLFRPNMQNEDHRRAWRLLQEVPEGQKSAFIVRAILQIDQEDRLETMLRRVLREEKATVAGQTDSSQETGLPDGMMGFLDALMDDLQGGQGSELCLMSVPMGSLYSVQAGRRTAAEVTDVCGGNREGNQRLRKQNIATEAMLSGAGTVSRQCSVSGCQGRQYAQDRARDLLWPICLKW